MVPAAGAHSGLESQSAPVAWIAYVRHNDVYVVDPANGETRRLTHGQAVRWVVGIAGDLSVSPDGTEVAYTGTVSRKSRFDEPRTIYVVPVAGGQARNATPWNSVGYGNAMQPEPAHIDPQWLDSTHLDYTDDLETNGQSYGVAMTVDLANGRHGHATVPRSARRQVLEPFVAVNGYTAYPVLDWRGYDCASTLDLARGSGSKGVRLTYTPRDDEQPFDINADGDVLAMRAWVVSGAHDGLCTFGVASLTYELIVVEGNGSTRVLRRFSDIKPSSTGPNFDAAWSPDGKQIAYIDQKGDLMLMTPRHASRKLVAGGVVALDW